MTSTTRHLDTWWERVLAGFSHAEPLQPDTGLLIGVLVLAGAVTLIPAVWQFFGMFVTFVHELGHAFAALMTGRFVKGISLHFDHSGQMLSRGKQGFSATWSGFWGYPAPALVGLGLIAAALTGWAPLALSLGALILLVSLIFIRNFAGILIALASAVVAQLLVMFVPDQWVAWVVLTLGVAIAVGSVKDLFKVIGVHTSRRHLGSSDAYILQASTRVPAGVWLTGFGLVVLGAAALDAWLLYRAFTEG